MKAPWFWRDETIAANIVASSLTPLSILYDGVQRLRWKMTAPKKATSPVICIGNATSGGVGKTPFAIALCNLLKTAGLNAHFSSRGYGGDLEGPVRVDPSKHDASAVGDEPLMLAQHAPAWIAKDRAAGAIEASKGDCDVVIMDDGFQNPSITKDLNLLVIDETGNFGNEKIFPAGPMREPLARALARSDAVILVSETSAITAPSQLVERLGPRRLFRCWLEPLDNAPPTRVVAFCGIGAPQRFFRAISRAGHNVTAAFDFPDHHAFSEIEIAQLLKQAEANNAALMTTRKDCVRLPSNIRDQVNVFDVEMRLEHPQDLRDFIFEALHFSASETQDPLKEPGHDRP